MKNYIVVTLLGGLLFFAGCGTNVKVSGKVSFEDGSPLTSGMLIFESGAIQSKAPIEKDGSYQVGTLKSNDGLPRGTYRVYISGADVYPDIDVMGHPLGKVVHLVDPKFTSPDTSELTCEVNGSRTFDITVTPPAK